MNLDKNIQINAGNGKQVKSWQEEKYFNLLNSLKRAGVDLELSEDLKITLGEEKFNQLSGIALKAQEDALKIEEVPVEQENNKPVDQLDDVKERKLPEIIIESPKKEDDLQPAATNKVKIIHDKEPEKINEFQPSKELPSIRETSTFLETDIDERCNQLKNTHDQALEGLGNHPSKNNYIANYVEIEMQKIGKEHKTTFTDKERLQIENELKKQANICHSFYGGKSTQDKSNQGKDLKTNVTMRESIKAFLLFLGTLGISLVCTISTRAHKKEFESSQSKIDKILKKGPGTLEEHAKRYIADGGRIK